MPFMHSESKLIHQYALKLFEDLGNPINLDFEQRHKEIIDRFWTLSTSEPSPWPQLKPRRTGFFDSAQQPFLTVRLLPLC